MGKTFFLKSDTAHGVMLAREYIEREFGISCEQNPDVSFLTYAVFDIDDARKVVSLASSSSLSGTRVFIISCERIFHEAQNALLKLFEEPPEDTTIFFITPNKAQLLPTFLSRLAVLDSTSKNTLSSTVTDFLYAGKEERAKYVAKLLARIKSDNEETKQEARTGAVELFESITRYVHEKWVEGNSSHLQLLTELNELSRSIRDRSAPYKLIFEHLLLVVPKFHS